jgi:hypothetical protein
MNTA